MNLTGFRMALKCGARYHVFEPTRISALLAQAEGSTVLVDDRELLADESLDSLEARLDPDQFFRIHRNAIINLSFLEELRREGDRQYAALLSNHFRTRAQVSRERLKALKDRLGM